MGFPETRLTLVQRLADRGSEHDWEQFLHDYWGPICGFASRWGGLASEDAEDVAALTIQAVLKGKLLQRWQSTRSARLRTLLCGVARNIISNQARVSTGRQRILKELAASKDLPDSVWTAPEPSVQADDAFYGAWADDLLQRTLDRLVSLLHRDGKGDCFRVLYGRICENLTNRQIARLLEIEVSTTENHFKTAKRRLTSELERAVRQHVESYCVERDLAAEFRTEWAKLSEHLQRHGGLEQAIRRCHEYDRSVPSPDRSATLLASRGKPPYPPGREPGGH